MCSGSEAVTELNRERKSKPTEPSLSSVDTRELPQEFLEYRKAAGL
jgi:hypothetical protein